MESYHFIRKTPYIYEENSQYVSVRLDRQAAFKSSTFWYVRAGKGSNKILATLENSPLCGACYLHSVFPGSSTFPGANEHDCLSSNVNFCVLNCSQNGVITWAIVCPVCRLSCSHNHTHSLLEHEVPETGFQDLFHLKKV